MAIKATVKLSTNVDLNSTYIRVVNPHSYKIIEKDEEQKDVEVLKLSYAIEYLSEKEGLKIKSEPASGTNYNGGNIWDEAYADLKKGYEQFENA